LPVRLSLSNTTYLVFSNNNFEEKYMKLNKILLSLLSAGVLVSPMAYATNGDEMMAIGSANSALGGTGVANYVGADSAWANPAMLGKSKGSEVVGGVNIFRPLVTNTGMGGKETGSSVDNSYIPDLSYSSRVDDSWSYGLAVAGTSGMGVNYTTATQTAFVKAQDNLQGLRAMLTLAYNGSNYGVGLSPLYQLSSLMLSYDATAGGGASVNQLKKTDSNASVGYSVGGYYDVVPTFTVAASYQSQLKASYGTQISKAATGFNTTLTDDLDQPAQIKAGVAFTVADGLILTADYKQIQWGQANGYKDFNWTDENVYALGAKYSGSGYWMGLGYNNSNNPIQQGSGTVYKSAVINMFNNMFFPAVITDSYTLGGGYSLSSALSLEGAVVYSPQVTTTTNISAVMTAFGQPAGTYTNTTTHSQQSAEVSLRYKF
jgi:long-chain fatty acid transport protein